MNRFAETNQLRLLDVGTGNGALLFKLAKKGFKGQLLGIDYSDFSIKLANRIKQDFDHEAAERITFRFENAFDLIDKGCFDIIHDKGTFDVVYMNKELDNREYAKAMHFRLSKDNPKAIFILTSCNLTSTEMDAIFTGEGLFKKLCEVKGYRSFTFGGVTG